MASIVAPDGSDGELVRLARAIDEGEEQDNAEDEEHLRGEREERSTGHAIAAVKALEDHEPWTPAGALAQLEVVGRITHAFVDDTAAANRLWRRLLRLAREGEPLVPDGRSAQAYLDGRDARPAEAA